MTTTEIAAAVTKIREATAYVVVHAHDRLDAPELERAATALRLAVSLEHELRKHLTSTPGPPVRAR